jgi:hypothetical protein
VTSCTNRLLLQFFNLKYTHNYPWDTLAEWMTQLLPQYPKSRFITKLKTAVTTVTSLSAAERQTFYDTEINLESIGPICDSLDLTRSKLLDLSNITPVNPEHFSNGLVVEIHNFCTKEKLNSFHLVSLVQRLGGHSEGSDSEPNVSTNALVARIKKICQTHTNMAKSRKRPAGANKFETYEKSLCTIFDSSVRIGQGDVVGQAGGLFGFGMVAGNSPTSNTNSPTTPKTTPVSHQRCDSKIRKISDDMNLAKQKISDLELKNTVLNDLCSEKQTSLALLESELHEKASSIKELQASLHSLTLELKAAEEDAAKVNLELKSFKSGAQYQKLRRKGKRLEAWEERLQAQESELDPSRVKQLKFKICGLQKTISYKNQLLKNKSTAMTKSKQEVAQLREELLLMGSYQGETGENVKTRTCTSGRPYTESIEKCVMHLVGELDVPSTKCSKVIQAVSKWIFQKDIALKDLPSSNTVIEMADRAHVLSKYQVGEALAGATRWDLHSDGTSRDHNKIIGQQVNISDVGIMSAGFSGVLTENHSTLLDNAIAMLEELADVYSSGINTDSDSKDVVYQMLQKLFGTMTDRCAVMKLYGKELDRYRTQVLGQVESDSEVGTTLHFLYCNAHFLLGLSSSCEGVLKKFEETLANELGHPLGRNAQAKFSRFSRGSESCVARYIRTACDSFGPRGDEKNGCRKEWVAFCTEKNVKSEITSFRMNRFNNFFQGAASLIHHQGQIIEYLSNYRESLNLKLESVLHDAKCCQVQALVMAVAILYYKVTGPFWLLLESDTEYVDQYLYVQEMLRCFENWSVDPSSLLLDGPGIFSSFEIEVPRDDVYQSLVSATSSSDATTKRALEAILVGFISCTKRQLDDFLPGGAYGSEPSQALRLAMKHCKLTNLVSENEFGDLDFSQYRRRHASLHFHSGIQMVKKNHTISGWLSLQSAEEQSRLLKFARTKSTEMRKKHMAAEKQILKETRDRMEEVSRLKKEKEAKLILEKRDLIASVQAYGGPCKCEADVKRMLRGLKNIKQKKDFLKKEIKYLKVVLGIKDKHLVYGKKDVDTLAADLILVLGLGMSDSESNAGSILPVPLPVEESAASATLVESRPANQEQRVCDTVNNQGPLDIEFKFEAQGTWVAVAYEDAFFIGMVMDVNNEAMATVQFLQRGYKDVFRWPRVDDVAPVEQKFVFAHGFEVEMSPNGRTWLIPELSYLEDLFDQYRELYF